MSHGKSQIYIVRVWKEGLKDRNWRGNIQNVRTGQRVSASNLNELAEFFRRYFSEETKPRPKTEKGLK